jgi:6-phosphogluconolactonase
MDVVVLADPDQMAAAAAARLIVALIDAQAARGHAHAVLTGGTGGTATLAAVAASPARSAVDWGAVDLWWGDERFLPAGHPDRNETQARDVLLNALPLDPARVHAMAPSDGAFGDDVDAAAAGYAADLATASAASSSGSPSSGSPSSGSPSSGSPDAGSVLGSAGSSLAVPVFDVLMLGVGPDGHVASLFPGHPGFAVTTGTAIAVRESPKPPPTRISLTLPVLQTARQTWLIAAGEGKADVVARAVNGEALPAGSVHGTERTLWLLDREAAANL